MRFTAPKHTSSAFLSTGEAFVDGDGVLEVPNDTPAGDLSGLQANGFELIPEVADAAPTKTPTPTPPAPTSGSDAA